MEFFKCFEHIDIEFSNLNLLSGINSMGKSTLIQMNRKRCVLALLKAKSGELLILENPEAHFHPKGQRKMGELIARASQGVVQVIVETSYRS